MSVIFFLDIVGQCELLFLVIQTFAAFKLLMDIVKRMRSKGYVTLNQFRLKGKLDFLGNTIFSFLAERNI